MLRKKEAHVWSASLGEMPPVQMERLRQGLSDDELRRAERFRFPGDRDHYIIARGILRAILAGYLNMKPEEVRFSYGPFGRPELAGDAGKKLCFSVSHSNGLALYAVVKGRRVGVDIEYIRSDIMVEDIARQFFTPSENILLETCPGQARNKAFFTLWARKEACLKAQGTGLAEAGALMKADRDASWSLADLDVKRGYAAAIAVEGRGIGLRCRQWVSGAPRIRRLAQGPRGVFRIV